MGESVSQSDPFDELAYEFAERLRRGERPSISEYTQRHPDLADEIRELFPTLAMMEHVGSEDGPRSARTSDLLQAGQPLPERLGDYRILREIGRGGMGVVYEAQQESLGRHVALKVLTQHRHMNSVQMIRFQREARAAASLHHTNIVPVFGVGVHEGFHYYAMQYIHGRSLDLVLREVIRLRGEGGMAESIPQERPDDTSASLAYGLMTNQFHTLPVPADQTVVDGMAGSPSGGHSPPIRLMTEAEGPQGDGPSSSSSSMGLRERHYYRSIARLGIQAAEALGHAHAHGLIHRDIKPANLLLDLDGTLWVTDFGLAKAEDSEELTSPGDVVGTLRYLAPERFRGVSDQRGDIYSLGVSLYELLTLRPAFSASHRLQLMNQISRNEPIRPRKLNPQIPLRPGNDRPESHRQEPGPQVWKRQGDGERAGTLHGRPTDPVTSGVGLRAALAMVTAESGGGHPGCAGCRPDSRTGHRLDGRGLELSVQRDQVREQRDVARKERQNTQAELARSLLQQVRAERYSRQPVPRAQRLERLVEAARLARLGMAEPELLTASARRGDCHPGRSRGAAVPDLAGA